MALSKSEKPFVDELRCAICLQFYCEPSSLPCGHSFCLACIAEVIRREDEAGWPHTCPECRGEHVGSSALQKNFKLANIVEGFKASDGTSPTKATCDVCLDSPKAAAKVCLKCEIAMCSDHLRPHFKPAFRGHVLVDPAPDLGGRRCSLHAKPVEYFCLTDKTCVCVVCAIEGAHKKHEVKNFRKARAELGTTLDLRLKEVDGKLTVCQTLLQRGKEAESAVKASNGKMARQTASLLDGIVKEAKTYKSKVMEVVEDEQRRVEDEFRGRVAKLSLRQALLKDTRRQMQETLLLADPFLFFQKLRAVEAKLAAAEGPEFALPKSIDLRCLKIPSDVESSTSAFRASWTKLQKSLTALIGEAAPSLANACAPGDHLRLSSSSSTLNSLFPPRQSLSYRVKPTSAALKKKDAS
ncbi:E3 ubiquitin/ISG15 ligase TRIM25-like [Lepisosteus oculatus]|uniref:Tripartite motif containing 25 n=1 Tax=Lepisosteus oculatus TaxID=7918 RepID=W5NNK8_LEPOC